MNRKLTWESVCWGLVITIAASASILTFRRLFYGIDFGDESYYVAMAYRFGLGDRPYVDEMFLHQGASLLLSPFVKAFVIMTGSNEGIVLFTRIIYFSFSLVVALGVYSFFRKELDKSCALLLALSYVTFIPFGIPNVSYNTLGSGLFTLGMLVVLKARLQGYHWAWICLGGALHGFAMVAHPTMIAGGFFFGSLLLLSYSEAHKYSTILYGTCFLMAPVSVLFLNGISTRDIHTSYVFTKIFSTWFGNNINFDKIVRLGTQLLTFCHLHWILLVYYFSLLLLLNIRPVLSILLLSVSLFPVLYYVNRPTLGGLGLHGFIFTSALLSPLLLGFVDKKERFKKLLMWMWLPSLGAGVCLSLTSSNGIKNAPFGLMPGFLLTAAGIVIILMDRASKFRYYSFSKVLPLGIVLALLIRYQYGGIYNDQAIIELTERVQTGPFKWLNTSAEKLEFLGRISEDVKKVSNVEGRIIFYEHFPAGYLLTSMRPATPNTWGIWGVPAKPFLEYYSSHESQKNVAVHVKHLFFTKHRTDTYTANTALAALIEKKLKPTIVTENYTVYAGRD